VWFEASGEHKTGNMADVFLPKEVGELLKVKKKRFLGINGHRKQCCGSGMFIPDPDPTVFYPGSGSYK
jgi:hypothetical protein